MDKLLTLLSQNARFTNAQLAVMLGTTEKEVEQKIEDYTKRGIIRGYKVLLDYEKLDMDLVMAFIEVKVTPKSTHGFDEIAKSIMKFHEVDSVYLISGGYDLSVIVTGKTFRDIAIFVSSRLAPLDSVISTRTNFVLTRYKEGGIVTCDTDVDERGQGIL
ncbi:MULTISPECIES: Lrp/AsnC family transcriptional regulator [Clostridiaceae]|uniref:Lrp/AsnC family transcriptional regulator n=1 Tax=Clostridium facile TaxID=2763035 RepID=A0ABR7IRR1_9CLOT|nr:MULTISPECIES: Lrp/AsnC family transcriptional regulator [Clostridiaceae]MBC5787758.1 Lrp/AsnC family transcriptional regulator [Clostridium facile]PWM98956.1 MAG: Lrp/AsnC family transcriptional regulator [Massilioclostridium sp.]